MIKITTNLYFILSSLFYYLWVLVFDGGVSAVFNAPDTIKPGETVSIEVSVNKGNTGGFAKLQVEVPQGFTISEEDSKGSNFSFNGTTAKWIWTMLPSEQQFKLKFKLTTSKSANGNISITGKYSYIENNTKQVVEIPAKNIFVGEGTLPAITTTDTKTMETASPGNTVTETAPPPTPPTNTTVAISNNTETPITNNVPPPTTPTVSEAKLLRTIEYIGKNTWMVKINISKNSLKGFARYNDVLPNGLTAKADEKDGSSFFVDAGTIKFVWSKLPDKSDLKISYKLTGKINDNVTLNGDFSYTENNQVQSAKLNPDVLTVPTEPITEPNPPTNTQQPITPKETISAKQQGVSFSVQLGAFQKVNHSTKYFSSKYGISNISQETHESYIKFFSGSYSEYKEARDYRESIKAKGIGDAFVIAHNNQKRISVQEALMTTNQKWFP